MDTRTLRTTSVADVLSPQTALKPFEHEGSACHHQGLEDHLVARGAHQKLIAEEQLDMLGV